MQTPPIISIIIAAHNNQQTIARCIDSFYGAITGRLIEAICVDDHCTDDTINIVRRFSSIRVVQAEDCGLGNARNTGIAHARGQYLWLVDADDTLDLTALDGRFLQKLRRAQPDLVVLGLRKVYKTKTTVIMNKATHQYDLTAGDNVEHVFQENILNNSWNKLYRRQLISQHHLTFATLPGVEDLIFNCDYLPFIKKLVTVDRVFYNYYVYSQTSTKYHWYPDQLHATELMINKLKAAAQATSLISEVNVTINCIDAVIGSELNYYGWYHPSLREFRSFVQRTRIRDLLRGSRVTSQLPNAYRIKYWIARSWLLSYIYLGRLANP